MDIATYYRMAQEYVDLLVKARRLQRQAELMRGTAGSTGMKGCSSSGKRLTKSTSRAGRNTRKPPGKRTSCCGGCRKRLKGGESC